MHHTTDKGDVGVAYVTADLISRGLTVLSPVSATSPFDLVVLTGSRATRIQVKYRAINSLGVLMVQIGRASITGSKFVRRVFTEEEVCECFAFYCPDTKECYYIDTAGKKAGSLILRVRPSRHAGNVSANSAKDFTCFPPRKLQLSPHIAARSRKPSRRFPDTTGSNPST